MKKEIAVRENTGCMVAMTLRDWDYARAGLIALLALMKKRGEDKSEQFFRIWLTTIQLNEQIEHEDKLTFGYN